MYHCIKKIKQDFPGGPMPPNAGGMGSNPSRGTHKPHRVTKEKKKRIEYLGIYLPRRQKACTQ